MTDVVVVLPRMRDRLKMEALKSNAARKLGIKLYLPEKSPWVSFDYGGKFVLSGKVVGEPYLVTFNEYETCWVIDFRPYREQVDHLLDEDFILPIRVEDIITIS